MPAIRPLARAVRRGAATAALLAGAAAAPAAADSIVYLDGGDVHALPDGGAPIALTADGTPDSPPFNQPDSPRGVFVGPYTSASADDAGRLLVARSARREDGSDQGPSWLWRAPDGSALAANLVSMRQDCGGAFSRPIGPANGRVSANGRWVAFSYLCGGTTYTAINFPDRLTEPWFQPPQWGFSEATWFGSRLVATDMTSVVAQDPGDAAPFEDGWSVTDLRGDAAQGMRLQRTEYTRDGTRAATLVPTAGGARVMALLRTAPPLSGGAEPSLQCFVPAAGGVRSMSWSPDGTRLAWQDDAGVQVAPVPPRDAEPGADALCPMRPAVVSATGSQPVFTAHTFGSAATPGPGGPVGPGGPAEPTGPGAPGGSGGERPAPAAAPRLALPRRATVRALRRGLPVRVRVRAAGRVTLTARLGRTVVARGTATARRPGAVRVRLALTRAGRRARLAGRRLTVRATLAPRGGGAPSTATGTLRAR